MRVVRAIEPDVKVADKVDRFLVCGDAIQDAASSSKNDCCTAAERGRIQRDEKSGETTSNDTDSNQLKCRRLVGQRRQRIESWNRPPRTQNLGPQMIPITTVNHKLLYGHQNRNIISESVIDITVQCCELAALQLSLQDSTCSRCPPISPNPISPNPNSPNPLLNDI